MDNFCKFRVIYSEKQREAIETEFVRLSGQYYLEHAGATLYSEKQLEEIAHQLCTNLYANPHAKNLSSKLTEDAIDIVRYQLLAHFKTTPDEYSVVFTSGATASLKLVAENFKYGPDGSLVYLQDNHTSVLGMRAYAPHTKCIKFTETLSQCKTAKSGNSLFVFPAQSNFSGVKYPLSWIKAVKKGALGPGEWYVVLDAAAFAPTEVMDLSEIKPDFVAISFCKIFGYPTGLGALLVRNESCGVLRKRYYGGGTVFMAQAVRDEVVMRDVIHERFEDGTVPFLSILALKAGFNTLKRLDLSFETISRHTFSLAQYVYRNLLCLHHSNGKPAVVLYHNTTFENPQDQGPIVNFNILRDNGEYVGYAEVSHFANLYNIHLRTGCFCNPGACQYFLNLSPEDVKKHYEAGHVCGDQHDLVDGYPTGSVRVSFGYMSRKIDADKLLEMVENCFVTKPVIKKIPHKGRNDYLIPTDSDYKLEEELDNNNSEGVLKQIILYPIKSCGGFSVPQWPLTSTGLKFDRQWMIINSSGVAITQKNNKKMCLIRPIIDLETEMLFLTYPGRKSFHVPINVSSYSQNVASLCQSKVCGDKIEGWDCGDEVSDWLSEVLECPGVRLLKQCDENEKIFTRKSTKNDEIQLSLVNKAQFLLINEASVEWLRGQIREEEFFEELGTTIQRFRANFVVRFNKEFTENEFGEFIFDDIAFEAGGVCTRCQMICIDQTTGTTSKEPLLTLSKCFKGKITFGVYLNRTKYDFERCLYVGSKVNGTKLK
ncbi:molybdenum cofactor sulfurase 1 [Tribolium castaneum]|uniref:Molybdenum cofactor sulfurase n=1 Tax=Tribolium castaneum TaxID=7070 RepID=D6W994_TRICA|nr:PREDICTED: molybdenum cofactor sulfurase 1 [Tribolium castaneum]EEZ98196.1 Molybdenum cofactor sulfurase-like Protein [Tribolium castaneum]|eukprot:XP_967646.1 PREDICTED: molybdenum cofactor sulfurase 1 [Tribolium castaneum]